MKPTISTTPFFITMLVSALLLNIPAHAANEDPTKNQQPTVIKFYAEWCGACKAVAAQYEEVSHDPEFKNVTFVDLNVEQHGQLAQEAGIVGIPTFLFVENGSVKNKEVGVKDISTFKDALRQTMRSTFGAKQTAGIQQATAATTQDSTAPAATQEMGILAKIQAILMTIVEKIKSIIVNIVHSIKGLFGK